MDMTPSRRSALVTGASSGIGAATALRLAEHGYFVYCVAPRRERLQKLASEIQGKALRCDVTNAADVAQLASAVGQRLDVLVNNAGGAIDLSTIADSDPDEWRRMYELNVLGTLQVTRAVLPKLVTSGAGTIINVGSTAGHEVYERGGGYTVAKHAVATLTRSLREELRGQPVRVCEIAPGMVKNEGFVLKGFRGDRSSADAVHAGVEAPLSADDIAGCITWIADRPHWVTIDLMVVRARAQVSQYVVHPSE